MTDRATGPAVSVADSSGTMPAPSTIPLLGLRPTTPFHADGAISEPEVSVPMLAIASRAAVPAADPALDPPVTGAPCGFIVCPPTALLPPVRAPSVMLPANSDRFALPRITAPEARSRATSGASAFATWSTSSALPAVVCIGGAVSMLSFTLIGMPSSGPSVRPALRRASAARASSSAAGFSSR